MKKVKQLTTDVMICPYCNSDNCEVRQAGHFVNTLLLICFKCQKAANYTGPTVKWTPQLGKEKVRTDFSPEPEF